jgi:hypothetical protein
MFGWNDHGAIFMACSVFAVVMARYRWRTQAKWWVYFAMGMLFAFGSQDFIPALAHWMG